MLGSGFRVYHMRNHGVNGHRGDLFSLGCLVHTLLSGKPPRRCAMKNASCGCLNGEYSDEGEVQQFIWGLHHQKWVSTWWFSFSSPAERFFLCSHNFNELLSWNIYRKNSRYDIMVKYGFKKQCKNICFPVKLMISKILTLTWHRFLGSFHHQMLPQGTCESAWCSTCGGHPARYPLNHWEISIKHIHSMILPLWTWMFLHGHIGLQEGVHIG